MRLLDVETNVQVGAVIEQVDVRWKSSGGPRREVFVRRWGGHGARCPQGVAQAGVQWQGVGGLRRGKTLGGSDDGVCRPSGQRAKE